MTVPQTGQLKPQEGISPSSGDWESEVEVLVALISEASLLALPTAAFLLFWVCARPWCLSVLTRTLVQLN